METLTSLTNPRIKALVRLQKGAERRKQGLFTIETARELDRALDAGLPVLELFILPEKMTDPPLLDRAARSGARLFAVTGPILDKISYRENPEGLVGVVEARTTPLEALQVAKPELFVLCSGLEKPGNVGAILRSADAAGASALLIDAPEADVFNPNCIRASTGAVFTVPIVRERPDVLLGWLKQHGVRLLVATPEAPHAYTQEDLTQPVALVLGAEAEGVDPFWRQAADLAVAIPMRGRLVDSLNVSVTAALLLFETARQRSSAGPTSP